MSFNHNIQHAAKKYISDFEKISADFSKEVRNSIMSEMLRPEDIRLSEAEMSNILKEEAQRMQQKLAKINPFKDALK